MSNQKDDSLTKSIEEMMFGFGDEWPPDGDAIALVEALVLNYISDLCVKARKIAAITGKLDKECFMFLVSKEPAKYNRLAELLRSNEELKIGRIFELAEIPNEQVNEERASVMPQTTSKKATKPKEAEPPKDHK